MEEMIQIFLAAIKNNGHVLKLIEKLEGLTIKLVCEGQEDFLMFHRGEVIFLVDSTDRAVTCDISGQRDSIYSLLEGKEKLRNLINNGQLKVKAPFRTILLIESIFYLTKSEERYRKFIS
ncbi:SCP2 sterol-binding domain-containing protein [Neobacillus sp. NPDC093182]|uniref:SCP2 sterol-binding domain-containing protein n=1 Tax=Neobacillus sp. NPDC093182 TaxID=3364297 RepID=UPI003830B962